MTNPQLITATTLLKLEYDEKALWFIGDILPTNSITLLTGPSDCGKSTFAKNIALAVASGTDTFMDYPINGKNRTVLYCSSEDNEITTVGRFKKQVAGMQIEKCDNLFFCFGPDNISKTLRTLETIKPGLIILDTLSDSYSGNPNSWSEIRSWLTEFRDLTEKYQCAIVGIHHNVKNSEKSTPDKNKVNGSQALEAVARSVIEIRMGKLDYEREVTILKNNYLPPDKKNKSRILNLCSDTSLFSLSLKTTGNGSGITHNIYTWVSRYIELNPDKTKSLDTTIGLLKEKYPDEQVPGKTWFSEKIRDEVRLIKEEIIPVHAA